MNSYSDNFFDEGFDDAHDEMDFTDSYGMGDHESAEEWNMKYDTIKDPDEGFDDDDIDFDDDDDIEDEDWDDDDDNWE